jgi:F-type H+-transporting ATPase subunit c
VKKYVMLASFFIALMVLATPAFAQTPGTSISFSRFFGAAITTMGAAYGIGKLASSALESMARQPEVAGSIQTAMIIAAALIEGFTFFALYICMSGTN